MTHSTLYVGDNTHFIEVSGLQDSDGEVQTDATVEVTALVDVRTGEVVTGITLPLEMPHIADGLYRATIDPGLDVVAGRKYAATIKAVGSQSFEGEWVETLVAKVRQA